MKILGALFLALILLACETESKDQLPPFTTQFEKSSGQETATYEELVDFYIQLARRFPEVNVQTVGETDSGYPLHVVTYNPEGTFNFQKLREEKTVILINNGIHPGESDGIDATMLLFRDLATGKSDVPKNTVLVTIPVYNVGGALNRNTGTRANQNGPKSYGFRGNALNYDLNRDFIKADSKNARTFTEIFHLVKPHVFIDTHVSNGADYQYTLTHLFTQHNKLGGELGEFVNQELMPTLVKTLKTKDWEIAPFVNVYHQVPEKGFAQFLDHPRYSTGYAALWNTLGLMVETHMLKPYNQRVRGTYDFLASILQIVDDKNQRIIDLRKNARTRHKEWIHYPISWAMDTTRVSKIRFKGYAADTLISKVTGFPRLKYDRTRPFTKEIPYQNHYTPIDSVKIPKAYILKKPWRNVLALLNLNKIIYKPLKQDTIISVESYRIKDYKTMESPYEGHYPHFATSVVKDTLSITFSEGDLMIPLDQPGIRYLLETLEPQASDSFFNWNFFDTILQRKEGFSPYVFEDIATKMLQADPQLLEAFTAKKKMDTIFANSWYLQLDWLYQRSRHYEKAHLQYPVYRLMDMD
ncbi:MAG: M14 family metallopeptidase [Bacteroidota bacterium]